MDQISEQIIASAIALPVEQRQTVLNAIYVSLQQEQPEIAETFAAARQEAWKLPYPEWKKEFDAFVAQQKPRNPKVDDSRESIYSEL